MTAGSAQWLAEMMTTKEEKDTVKEDEKRGIQIGKEEIGREDRRTEGESRRLYSTVYTHAHY